MTTLKQTAHAALLLAAVALAHSAYAQAPDDDATAVMTIVDEALERVSEEDMIGFTDLMMEGAAIGAAGERPGSNEYFAALRSRAIERSSALDFDIVERGFDPEVMIAGPVAMAWVPYDLYRDGEWSHCGIDVFSLLRTESGWRIASIVYSVEQPPTCEPHPDGPPAGARGAARQ
jgi:hypothetical protein